MCPTNPQDGDEDPKVVSLTSSESNTTTAGTRPALSSTHQKSKIATACALFVGVLRECGILILVAIGIACLVFVAVVRSHGRLVFVLLLLPWLLAIWFVFFAFAVLLETYEHLRIQQQLARGETRQRREPSEQEPSSILLLLFYFLYFLPCFFKKN